jgi:hypothetical protein
MAPIDDRSQVTQFLGGRHERQEDPQAAVMARPQQGANLRLKALIVMERGPHAADAKAIAVRRSARVLRGALLLGVEGAHRHGTRVHRP